MPISEMDEYKTKLIKNTQREENPRARDDFDADEYIDDEHENQSGDEKVKNVPEKGSEDSLDNA